MNTTRRLPVETQLTLLLTFGFMAAMAMTLLLIHVLRGTEPEQARIWLASGIITVMTIALIATTVLASRLVLRRMQQDVDARMMTLLREQTATAEQLREAATQEERNRLARDLHDTIKQQLFSINVAAATAQSLSELPAIQQQVQQVRKLSQAAMTEMKALLSQLCPRPLDTLGLIGAIQEQLDALKFRAEVTTELHAGGLPDESQLPAGAHAALFRVAQEALSNVARHARAAHVSVGFERVVQGRGELLRLTIADDGQGFDTAGARAGMGLGNMHARIAELGGVLQVQSAIGNGTTVIAEMPLITAHALREQAMREKEERFQLVHWAGGATSLLSMLGIAGVIALVAMAIAIAGGNAQMWAAFILTLALVTAFVMGALFACVSLRRRVVALGDANSIWRALLQQYDLTQLVSLAGLLAWIAFTLRQFGLAALLAAIAIAAAFFVQRSQRETDVRIGEWATLRGLRSRMGEMRALLLFGVTMIALTLAGAFGDLSRVALFHDRFDLAWMTSFIFVIYPVIALSSVLGMVGLRRQMALLHAAEPTNDDFTSDVETIAPAVQQQRGLARGLALLFIVAAALIGAGMGMGSAVLAGVALGACVAMWLAKARIEGGLTARVESWSTLAKQRAARMTYLFLLVVVVVMVASGVIGGIVGYTTAPAEPASGSTRSLPQLFGLLTAVLASPAHVSLMLMHAHRRVRKLEAQNKETATA